MVEQAQQISHEAGYIPRASWNKWHWHRISMDTSIHTHTVSQYLNTFCLITRPFAKSTVTIFHIFQYHTLLTGPSIFMNNETQQTSPPTSQLQYPIDRNLNHNTKLSSASEHSQTAHATFHSKPSTSDGK